MKNKIILGCLAAATCEILFGLSFIFTKSITAQVSDLALISWRFVTAFLFINLYFPISRRRITINGRNLKPLTRIAILNPIIYFICETIGIRMTTASESGAFLACIPVVALIMSSLILKEWPSRWQVVGVITTLIGIIIAVFAAGGSTHFSLVGYLILGLAVVSYALYCVDVERASQFSSLEITYFMLASGCLTFGLFALSQGFLAGDLKELLLLPVTNPKFTITILYQGLGCSVLGYLLSNFAIATIGVNRTASFIGISTIISILAAVVVLGEPFSHLQIFAGILVVLGVYVANKN